MYDLTGLPTEHRCPECGFAFDSVTGAWTGPGLARLAGIWCGMFCILALGAWVLFNVQRPTDARFYFVLVGLGLWAVVAARAVLLYRERPFIAVRRDGIVVCWSHDRPQTIGWDRFSGLERTYLGRRARARLILRPHAAPIDVSAFLRDEASIRAFEKNVQAALERRSSTL